jgi:hypothetical protein
MYQLGRLSTKRTLALLVSADLEEMFRLSPAHTKCEARVRTNF